MRWGRPIWFLVVLAGIVMFIGDTVASWPFLHTACSTGCHSGQPNLASARTLQSLGVSLNAFAAWSLTRDVAVMLIWLGTAALIIMHRPRDRGPLVAAFFLVLFTMNPGNSVATPPGWHVALALFSFIAGSVYIVFGLLFPDGRFVPHWTRWVALIWILLVAYQSFAPSALVNDTQGPAALQVLLPVILIATVLGAQVYRYRRVSGWEERQQMKWVLYGLGVSVVGMIALNIGYAVAPGGGKPGSLYDLSAYTAFPLVNTAIPISIGFAMLRSRLWDVDRVINRTLVYGSLTLSLAGLYIGGVIGLQALFQAITGQSSDLAIAVATLAVAALFNPWRHSLQAFIDRRFYRRKYDATRILAAFNATLRDDVDLDHLSADIAAVVNETVNPAYLSLWLRPEATR